VIYRLQTWFWSVVDWLTSRVHEPNFGPDDPVKDAAAAKADAPTAEPDTP
jgi:hypothetical protein